MITKTDIEAMQEKSLRNQKQCELESYRRVADTRKYQDDARQNSVSVSELRFASCVETEQHNAHAKICETKLVFAETKYFVS